MVCQSCGNQVEGAFCSRCGAQVQAAPPVSSVPPPMMYIPRVQQHVQTLGILWCVYGVYRAVAGIFAALFLLGMSRPGFFGDWGAHGDFPMLPHVPWMGGLAAFVAVVTLVFATLSFIVGFSLMNRKPWGRTLAIVVAILQLIKIPFGTALGIYTLWVLAPATPGAEYDAIANRS
jgi:hypothetical protein